MSDKSTIDKISRWFKWGVILENTVPISLFGLLFAILLWIFTPSGSVKSEPEIKYYLENYNNVIQVQENLRACLGILLGHKISCWPVL
ncbi:hypothetical protein E1J53_0022180 [Lewinella sp. W8]|nr:hypothetical protein [Lewinella sp. W8]